MSVTLGGGPRRASRARRCTVSSAPTGSTPGTGTGRSRTARRGGGCSRRASRSRARATPSSPRCAGGRSTRPCACGRFARRSRRRRRFARAATGGCPRCGTGSSACGGPTSSPMGWRASSRGFARRSTGGRGGTCPIGANLFERVLRGAWRSGACAGGAVRPGIWRFGSIRRSPDREEVGVRWLARVG